MKKRILFQLIAGAIIGFVLGAMLGISVLFPINMYWQSALLFTAAMALGFWKRQWVFLWVSIATILGGAVVGPILAFAGIFYVLGAF